MITNTTECSPVSPKDRASEGDFLYFIGDLLKFKSTKPKTKPTINPLMLYQH